MKRDIRSSDLYREAHALYEAIRRPGTGLISDAADVHSSPGGRRVVFAGASLDKLEGSPSSRICEVEVDSGALRVLSFGPGADRLPKYSPDGRHIAFLSDRNGPGDFQLFLLDPATGGARSTPRVDGWVEYLHWSPDGRRILLGVAGHGADLSGGQGAVASAQSGTDAPSWMPAVESGDETYRWRRAWIYELATQSVRQVSAAGSNIWEVNWCGNDALVAVVSPGPGEGLWYTAQLHRIDVETGQGRVIHEPKDQLGWPVGSPSGRHVAVIEALCSDRWIVAGDLRIIDNQSGRVQPIDTRGVDITHTEWRSDRHLLFAGHRGFHTVVALYDVTANSVTEVWSSDDVTGAGRFINLSGFGESGNFVLIGESFTRAPEIAVVQSGQYRTIRSFDVGYAARANAIAAVERVTWKAKDGLEIYGWLLRPKGKGPHPLVMNVHGGPVWHWRPLWLGRPRHAPILMLVERGYAVFFPNPRGSAGRGQAFSRHVLGDMGGADTYDYLSGLDHLVANGIADPKRLGVMGISYGGFMTSWLITQDPRFAAAVSVSPVINQVTQHLISNIPHFVALFLDDHYKNAGGRYYTRSPIMYAHKARTPTLNVCGALDRCTPPEEAVQFHSALLENRVESVLVTYPQEGHGVQKFPAAVDYAARVLEWFLGHMPPDRSTH
jgi:dipeptidyl aminopeptidase/acylaminoacyl peptidase